LKKGLIYTTVLCLGVWVNCAIAETGSKLMGDVSDGSRAVPVHVIELLNEEGDKIKPTDEPLLPFSTQKTCGACHSYDTISTGWHFNAIKEDTAGGKSGQPWIYVDVETGTQVPLSYRPWPGAFRPEQFGLSSWKFVKLFGRQMPGGGPGEAESDNPDEMARGFVSGKLEINCLSCHNGSAGHDQTAYADQIARENFRWAATASCSFSRVSGSAKGMPNNYDYLMPGNGYGVEGAPPKVEYLAGTFDPKGKVFFDIRRKILNERCYFCHSAAHVEEKGVKEKWQADEDVHLSSGLYCIDCHRNGIEHNITRGYEGESKFSKNPLAESLTCKGCHLGTGDKSRPTAGRQGAPVLVHRGIPALHFDKLACTACHGEPYPREVAGRVKTAMAHGLGIYNSDKSAEALPHIAAGVFARGQDGKIAPHELVWPAFWGSLKDDKVSPVSPDTVRSVIAQIIPDKKSSRFSDEQVVKILTTITSEKIVEGEAVYICGGRMHSIGDDGKLMTSENESAKPYMWPIAIVRPTAQSLGLGGCGDCHARDAAFFFGKVAVDSPLASEAGFVEMIKFQGVDPVYTRVFASSLLFFRFAAVAAVVSSGVTAAVLVLYGFAGLARVLKMAARKK
jgi:hypothetical protein